MWISRNVSRASRIRSPGSSSSGSARQRSRAHRRSSRICSCSSGCESGSAHAFSARPRTPIVSACRVHRSGVAIERYWWTRASVIDWVKSFAPCGFVGSGPRLAAGDPVGVVPEDRADLRLVEARGARCLHRQQERARLLAVRVVRGVQDLLRRHLAEEVEQVDGAPDRGVEEDPAAPRETRREPGHVGDPRVRDDEGRIREALVEPGQVVGDRRQAAPAVDQDRHASLRRQREHRREPLVVQREALRPRVELDPARAGVEAALRLGDRLLGQVEADERDESTLGALGVRERPVVRRAERGMAVGLSRQNMKLRAMP